MLSSREAKANKLKDELVDEAVSAEVDIECEIADETDPVIIQQLEEELRLVKLNRKSAVISGLGEKRALRNAKLARYKEMVVMVDDKVVQQQNKAGTDLAGRVKLADAVEPFPVSEDQSQRDQKELLEWINTAPFAPNHTPEAAKALPAAKNNGRN